MDYPRKILDRSVPWFDRRFAKDIQLTCVTLCCVDNIPFTKQKQTKHKKKPGYQFQMRSKLEHYIT